MADRDMLPTIGATVQPLVGRERELALLWSRYEAAAQGQLTVALVTGEPGIGKTSQLTARAKRDGALAQHGFRAA